MSKAKYFSSQESAETYVLQQLKKQYGIDFAYCYEWEGKPTTNDFEEDEWIKSSYYLRALVEPACEQNEPNHPYCKYNIVADSTGLFNDGAHAYFYRDRITERIIDILKEKKFIKNPYIRIVGSECKTGKWTGKEPFEKYLAARDFSSWVYLYLKPGLTDDEHAEQIRDILELLYKEPATLYNITLEIRLDDDIKDSRENRKGTCIFFHDLDQHNLKIDHWTKENIIDDIHYAKLTWQD